MLATAMGYATHSATFQEIPQSHHVDLRSQLICAARCCATRVPRGHEADPAKALAGLDLIRRGTAGADRPAMSARSNRLGVNGFLMAISPASRSAGSISRLQRAHAGGEGDEIGQPVRVRRAVWRRNSAQFSPKSPRGTGRCAFAHPTIQR